MLIYTYHYSLFNCVKNYFFNVGPLFSSRFSWKNFKFYLPDENRSDYFIHKIRYRPEEIEMNGIILFLSMKSVFYILPN
jgi:hypothetical protein